jgi:hypothetical protein
MKLALLLALSAALSSVGVRAELWTNQAGKIIEAELAKIEGTTVTLVRTNGSRIVLPLSALSKADQQRAKRQTGETVAPPVAQAAYRDARAILERFAALPAGQRTPEARTAAIRTACAVFDGRLKPHAVELQDANVAEEVKRMRDSLETP